MMRKLRKLISIRMNEPEYQALVEKSNINEITVSEFIRLAVKERDIVTPAFLPKFENVFNAVTDRLSEQEKDFYRKELAGSWLLLKY